MLGRNEKYAVASACGAVIGYSIGLTFLSGVWLVFAVLIGGVCGWILFDSGEFVNSFSKEFHKARTTLGSKLTKLRMEPYRKIVLKGIEEGVDIVIAIQFVGSVVAWVSPLFSSEDITSKFYIAIFIYCLSLVLGVIILSVYLIQTIKTFVLGNGKMELLQNGDEGDPVLLKGSSLKFFALTNPIIIPFSFFGLVCEILVSCARRINLIINFFLLVVYTIPVVTLGAFVVAHNNSRLTSLLGATLGAILGIMYGHVLVALLAGALSGIVFHSIILLFPKPLIGRILSRYEMLKSSWSVA